MVINIPLIKTLLSDLKELQPETRISTLKYDQFPEFFDYCDHLQRFGIIECQPHTRFPVAITPKGEKFLIILEDPDFANVTSSIDSLIQSFPTLSSKIADFLAEESTK